MLEFLMCKKMAVQLDLPLLAVEHVRKPNDTRVTFYLAQTLDVIGDLPAALDMYQKRIDMGGWQQEIFEAHMRRVGTPFFFPQRCVSSPLSSSACGA